MLLGINKYGTFSRSSAEHFEPANKILASTKLEAVADVKLKVVQMTISVYNIWQKHFVKKKKNVGCHNFLPFSTHCFQEDFRPQGRSTSGPSGKGLTLYQTTEFWIAQN